MKQQGKDARTRKERENEQVFLGLVLNTDENLIRDEAGSVFEAIDKSRLSPEDFYEPKHKIIFAAMRELVERGIHPSYGNVYSQLKKSGTFDDAGQEQSLNTLSANISLKTPIKSHVEFLADEIREQGKRRRYEDLMRRKLEALSSGRISPDELAASPIIPDEIGDSPRDISAFKDNSALIETLRQMDAGTWKNPAFATGFDTLDRLLSGGFLPGGLYVVGGYPGTGKTAFCTNILANSYNRNPDFPEENTALFVSFEMTIDEIKKRITVSIARVPFPKTQGEFNRIRQRNRKGIENLIKTLGNVQSQKCLIWSYPDVKNPEMLAREILSAARRFKPKVIFIDYLQIIPDESGSDAFGRAGDAARKLKTLAGKLGVPVVLLSQLNNNSANEKREPGLQDFRNSGEIAAAADVCLIFYENRAITEEEKAIAYGAKSVFCKVAKNRDGLSGRDVSFEFNGETMSFTDKGLKPAQATPARK